MVVLRGGRWSLSATALLSLSVGAVTLGAPAALRAQGEVGSLTGRVTEAGAATPVAGASIRVLVLTTRAVVGGANSNEDGRYRVGNLQPGTYAVNVSRIGYRPRTDTVRVSAGAATTHDVAIGEGASILSQVVTTASRGASERLQEVPASISVVNTEVIETRPTVTAIEHLRETPGINISTAGIAQSNVVARGFNNAFSGALLTLQDYKFAGVPSLRVNVPFLVPGTNEDIERIEVLLGPASALYGPNSANGVMHIITKSPFSSPGTTITVDGGERSIFRGALRHAQLLGEKAAIKVSGEYFTGRDFEFRDQAEPAQFGNQAPPGRRGTANARDYDVERYSGEARLDLRPTPNTEAVTTIGYTNVGNGVELTGANGAAQIRNWTYTSLQQRLRWNRLFGQIFVNLSDAGNRDSLDLRGTYLLRTGVPIVDQSRVFAAQLQHGVDLGGDRQRFLYGADYIMTNPRTGRTINGNNEDVDDVREIGAYVQSTTRVTSKFDVIGALRVDQNDQIEGTQVSPRAALVFKPTENHNLRATYNRAFQTPANFSFFLDLPQQSNVGGLPYNVRARGNPPKEGWQYERGCTGVATGGICMRSPFLPNNGAFVPASANLAYQGTLTALAPRITTSLTQAFVAQGLPQATAAAQAAQIVGFLRAQSPAAADVGTRIAFINDPGTVNRAPSEFRDIKPLEASYNTTYELGYKGLLGTRARLAIDLWSQERGDVGTPAGLATPNVFFSGQALGAYIGTRLATPQAAGGAGLPAAQAQAIAAALAPTLAAVPVGLVTFANGNTNAVDILATYQTLDKKVNLWGTDVAFDYLFTDRLSAAATFSRISDKVFEDVRGADGRALMLNAPDYTASLAVRMQAPADRGFGWELRGRYANAFPVNSGVYASGVNFPLPNPTAGGPTNFQYDAVPVNMLLDAGINYRFLVNGKRVLWSLNGSNVLDNEVPTFAGTAAIGRVIMTRLQYSF
ncbi:TonB-dependent receptor [Roseisolibacter agri]|uniref:TonB-dependent receptor n=1 Tax=Roseisolibacter agri TaxID=2014610 RepID=A0AA37Q6L4_9BACT|nr:TonB-dependent receptor [Roseisolibacter agri]GLC27515.1 hypothetical protein rosag_40280 [Roseisolibacter agri]